MQLLESLKWRYATKKMNNQPVAQKDVDKIIEAAHMAPTSSGLQPFRVIEISNPELKKAIQPLAMGQSQIVDSSHLLVFAAWDIYTPERINAVFEHTAKEREVSVSVFEDYKNSLIASFGAKTAQENFEHAARQAYIGFGMAIAAAAELKVDATPMEGFNPTELDKLLGLNEKGLKSVTILALGYRDTENDWLLGQKKVRTPKADFLIEMN